MRHQRQASGGTHPPMEHWRKMHAISSQMLPVGNIYHILIYIFPLIVHVGKYSIHGAFGFVYLLNLWLKFMITCRYEYTIPRHPNT